jgi:hypothetical protein
MPETPSRQPNQLAIMWAPNTAPPDDVQHKQVYSLGPHPTLLPKPAHPSHALRPPAYPKPTCPMRFWSRITSFLHSGDMSCSSKEFCKDRKHRQENQHTTDNTPGQQPIRLQTTLPATCHTGIKLLLHTGTHCSIDAVRCQYLANTRKVVL